MRSFFVGALALLLGSQLLAQHITNGPVISGVTDHSARIFVRTSQAAPVTLLLYTDSTLVSSSVLNTLAEADSSNIFDLTGLNPYTRYRFSLAVNGEVERQGSFRTFPKPDQTVPFSFTFGSCIEHMRGDSIFVEMEKHHPAFFLHLGDWTYPDHENYPIDTGPGENQFYSVDYSKVQLLYRVRYSMPNMNKMMAQTPIDFIHDDDDFVFDENSRNVQSASRTENGKTVLYDRPLPPGARHNVIQGYMQFFPHYPMEHDTAEGLYHKFRYGNVEVFFIDSRADRSSENDAYRTDKKGKIHFEPADDHTILGKQQMQWLLDSLKNSTADWKFIVSGTNFNMGYRRAIDLAVMLQGMQVQEGRTGASVAASMAAMWVGYPFDQARLINFCADNKITNVIVLSGDAHCSAIDDGKNAGLPELMSGNLGVPNSHISDLIENRIGLNIWDKGGQGIGNTNFNNCFGQIDVYGKDSVQLNIIDQYGTKITSTVLKNGIVARHVRLKNMQGHTAYTRFRTLGDFFRLAHKMAQHHRQEKRAKRRKS